MTSIPIVNLYGYVIQFLTTKTKITTTTFLGVSLALLAFQDTSKRVIVVVVVVLVVVVVIVVGVVAQ